jgi:hypothetical protein
MSQGSQNNSQQGMDYTESFKMKSYGGDNYVSSNIFNNNLGGEHRPSYNVRDEVLIENQYNYDPENKYGNYESYGNNEERDIEIFEDKENHIEEMMMEEEPEEEGGDLEQDI